MVERPKNHWCQWPETKKHSMVIVSSKNVEVYNVFCKIIDISNVLCKLHIISCILQYRFWYNGRTDNTFFPFMQACVSLQVEFTHFLLHWIFQTKKLCYHRSAPRQDHCFSINANESNLHSSTQLVATNLFFCELTHIHKRPCLYKGLFINDVIIFRGVSPPIFADP